MAPAERLLMSVEVHIAGVIVHTVPAQLDSVRASIGLLPRARVHAAAADGRMVVTLEAESTLRTLDYLDALHALPGVLNVAMVYQHVEDAAAMEEEVS